MITQFEDWHNSSLYVYIKDNEPVTKERIIKENHFNLIDSDLEKLLKMGKIKFQDGFYTTT